MPVLTAMFTTITYRLSPRRGNLGEMCHLDVVVGAISTCPHNIHVCSTRFPCSVLSYLSWNQQLSSSVGHVQLCLDQIYRSGHGRPHHGPPNNLHQGKHTCTHLKEKSATKRTRINCFEIWRIYRKRIIFGRGFSVGSA